MFNHLLLNSQIMLRAETPDKLEIVIDDSEGSAPTTSATMSVEEASSLRDWLEHVFLNSQAWDEPAA